MTASILKWLALLTMALDHLGYMFFPEQQWIRLVGRLSFPIFAFLLAQGFVHTKSRAKYGLRLGLFVVLAEVPYDLALYGSLMDWAHQSIMLTLFLGFLALLCVDWCQRRKNPLYAVGAAVCAVAAMLLQASYGIYGICLIVGFYLLRKYPGALPPILIALTWGFYGFTNFSLTLWGSSFQILSINNVQLYAIAAALPIAFYSGKQGAKGSKWFFYCFYPLHLLLYWAVQQQLWRRIPLPW